MLPLKGRWHRPNKLDGSGERVANQFRRSFPAKFSCHVVMFRGWFS